MNDTRDDDFSNAPVSIGEARANREKRSDRWTVRDMLVSMLREIDSGEKPMPDRAIVVFQRDDPSDGIPITGYWIAQANRTTVFGMMEIAKLNIYEGEK